MRFCCSSGPAESASTVADRSAAVCGPVSERTEPTPAATRTVQYESATRHGRPTRPLTATEHDCMTSRVSDGARRSSTERRPGARAVRRRSCRLARRVGAAAAGRPAAAADILFADARLPPKAVQQSWAAVADAALLNCRGRCKSSTDEGKNPRHSLTKGTCSGRRSQRALAVPASAHHCRVHGTPNWHRLSDPAGASAAVRATKSQKRILESRSHCLTTVL